MNENFSRGCCYSLSLSHSLFLLHSLLYCLRSLNRHLSPFSRGKRSDFALVPVYREKLNLYREENAKEIRWYPAQRIRVSWISPLSSHFSLIRMHDVARYRNSPSPPGIFSQYSDFRGRRMAFDVQASINIHDVFASSRLFICTYRGCVSVINASWKNMENLEF